MRGSSQHQFWPVPILFLTVDHGILCPWHRWQKLSSVWHGEPFVAWTADFCAECRRQKRAAHLRDCHILFPTAFSQVISFAWQLVATRDYLFNPSHTHWEHPTFGCSRTLGDLAQICSPRALNLDLQDVDFFCFWFLCECHSFVAWQVHVISRSYLLPTIWKPAINRSNLNLAFYWGIHVFWGSCRVPTSGEMAACDLQAQGGGDGQILGCSDGRRGSASSLHSHGGTSIAGWFIRENPRNGWFRGTPISGNPHIMIIYDNLWYVIYDIIMILHIVL